MFCFPKFSRKIRALKKRGKGNMSKYIKKIFTFII